MDLLHGVLLVAAGIADPVSFAAQVRAFLADKLSADKLAP